MLTNRDLRTALSVLILILAFVGAYLAWTMHATASLAVFMPFIVAIFFWMYNTDYARAVATMYACVIVGGTQLVLEYLAEAGTISADNIGLVSSIWRLTPTSFILVLLGIASFALLATISGNTKEDAS